MKYIIYCFFLIGINVSLYSQFFYVKSKKPIAPKANNSIYDEYIPYDLGDKKIRVLVTHPKSYDGLVESFRLNTDTELPEDRKILLGMADFGVPLKSEVNIITAYVTGHTLITMLNYLPPKSKFYQIRFLVYDLLENRVVYKTNLDSIGRLDKTPYIVEEVLDKMYKSYSSFDVIPGTEQVLLYNNGHNQKEIYLLDWKSGEKKEWLLPAGPLVYMDPAYYAGELTISFYKDSWRIYYVEKDKQVMNNYPEKMKDIVNNFEWDRNYTVQEDGDQIKLVYIENEGALTGDEQVTKFNYGHFTSMRFSDNIRIISRPDYMIKCFMDSDEYITVERPENRFIYQMSPGGDEQYKVNFAITDLKRFAYSGYANSYDITHDFTDIIDHYDDKTIYMVTSCYSFDKADLQAKIPHRYMRFRLNTLVCINDENKVLWVKSFQQYYFREYIAGNTPVVHFDRETGNLQVLYSDLTDDGNDIVNAHFGAKVKPYNIGFRTYSFNVRDAEKSGVPDIIPVDKGTLVEQMTSSAYPDMEGSSMVIGGFMVMPYCTVLRWKQYYPGPYQKGIAFMRWKK